ncbi:hypothetical protein BD779DRAFT_1668241 [Infundibulicybe gibba]|nr:hypothetical protein BD779DRAFT_1668241 [Infundibulicybe gibba]
MASSAILRRVTAISKRPATYARYYATRPEPDPQLNGYPELPFVSRQHLPANGWQDSLLRRNFGDTLHEQDEVLSMWGPDIPPLPPHKAVLQFTIAVLGFVGAGFFIKSITPDAPATRREYPYSGLVTELGGLHENQARSQTSGEEDS